MNDIKELVSHGISETTAKSMLDDYDKRIGTMNGVYEIVDINYDFNERGKDVMLRCSGCGKTIHRIMINGRNKWSELIKTCKDCEERKRKDDLEKSEMQKKDEIISHIGRTCGDYLIIDAKFGVPDKLIGKCQVCGSIKEISYPHFKSGQTTDFKCRKHYEHPTKYNESYIGKRYGRLVVIGVDPGCIRKFKCQCDCGNVYYAVPCNLEDGSVKSCGCLKDDISENAVSNDRLYKVWQSMKERCFNKSSKNYRNYGERGISICEQWANDYLSFKRWAYSNGYDENASFGECTIDRIDVNGNYEPSNCRWITSAEQQKNKRPSSEWRKRNVKRRSFVTFNGNVVPKYDLCQKFGISVETFSYRINKKGMSIEEALKTSKMCAGRPKIKK